MADVAENGSEVLTDGLWKYDLDSVHHPFFDVASFKSRRHS
nr:hypothetical protein [Pseudomonas syringae]